MTPRLGRQTPTTALVLPYSRTKGHEAVELYGKTGRKPREWQEIQIYDIMAVDKEDIWVHSTYGYSVPRRNGKTEIIIMRMIWGLTHGEKILYTAHNIATAHSVWETLTFLLDSMEIEYASVKAKGQENVRLFDDKGKAYKLDHSINFRTRSNTGGLGEGYDLLIIDEAQEYTIDQESALKYVISASDNPQTIMLGTPPTAISHGTVFQKLREKVLSGESRNTGWAEWSVEFEHDPNDREAWYETNPSLGYDHAINERVIENENTTDDTDFNIQRLGMWIAYSQHSAITEKEWNSLKVEKVPKFTEKLYVGIKFGRDGKNVAMSIATRLKEKIFVECIDCRNMRSGDMWMIDFLSRADIEKVAIDGAGKQDILKQEMKDYGIRIRTVLPTVKDIIFANSSFEKAVISSKTICHNGQISLADVVSNCEKRAIGTSGGFGYRALKEEYEIALMDSVILAYWLCSQDKPKRKAQRIIY